MLRHWLRASVLAICLALTCSGAGARVSNTFVGMNADEPLFNPSLNLSDQFGQMAASGVESLRVAISWASAQPYASMSDVPPDQVGQFQNIGGIPTTFAATDGVVGLAAMRGLQLLPTVLYAPSWDVAPNSSPVRIPRSNAPYANFLAALVNRYGPRGRFWQANPGIPYRPIRIWQIWNEPNLPYWWGVQPFARTYVALLRAAHVAIKSADPRAEVVLAGLPNFSWNALRSIYRIRGARKAFDVVAVHPYTSQPAGVITILNRVRDVMKRAGDRRKPIIVTEVGWGSSNGKTALETTEAGQAHKIASLLPLLANNRKRLRLLGFFYYTWVASEPPGGLWSDFAGLFRLTNDQLSAKPAFFAFRRAALAVEGCLVRATVAPRCLKPALSRPHKA